MGSSYPLLMVVVLGDCMYSNIYYSLSQIRNTANSKNNDIAVNYMSINMFVISEMCWFLWFWKFFLWWRYFWIQQKLLAAILHKNSIWHYGLFVKESPSTWQKILTNFVQKQKAYPSASCAFAFRALAAQLTTFTISTSFLACLLRVNSITG